MDLEYSVTGMTCDHCARSVGTELGKLVGVRDVRVDLVTGRVSVTSDEQLDREAVAAAIDEAGYELADA